MFVYSDEDNVPMTHDIPREYTAVINERLFRETGELVIKTTRAERSAHMHGEEGQLHDSTK